MILALKLLTDLLTLEPAIPSILACVQALAGHPAVTVIGADGQPVDPIAASEAIGKAWLSAHAE
jgi:hypothetical protein